MGSRLAAVGVHLLTASGAVCALLASLAVIEREWQSMFVWLGVALIVDAVDGPLARAAHVRHQLPRFSGERLDLIIDYLTYVFIPAVALVRAGYLPGPGGIGLAALILLSSLFHFADMNSKTDDHHFVGFPAIWNVVALYIFVWDAGALWAGVAVFVCCALTFVPVHWVHPVRVTVLRPVTAVVCAIWATAAVSAVVGGFPAGPEVGWALTLCAVYGVVLTVWRTWLGNGRSV
jgi:phosphatidylcholine synthase